MEKYILFSMLFLFIDFGICAQDGSSIKNWIIKEKTAGVGLSKDLNFEVHGRYKRPIRKETLNGAKLLGDFIDGYPVNWITGNVTVEILAICNGKAIHSVSKSEVLTSEQKNILKTVDLNSNIEIKVKYKNKDTKTGSVIDQEMNVIMTVIPETEAEYVGGEQKLKTYINEKVKNKMPATIAKQINLAKAIFTVNEEGETVNAKMARTSGDSVVDQLMVDAINKMPKWKPARNSNGIKVKQEFELFMENTDC